MVHSYYKNEEISTQKNLNIAFEFQVGILASGTAILIAELQNLGKL